MAENRSTLAELRKHVPDAVRFYWQTRFRQLQKQRAAGGSDQGLRSAVTGGAQMDGFIKLLTQLVIEAGIDRAHIHYQDSLELPGYFRPNKKWDFIVVVKGQLVAALEAKSQVGPSFGNNFNNRTEEAMGSALDLWTAFREKAFGSKVRPWIGYMFPAGGLRPFKPSGRRQRTALQSVPRISRLVLCEALRIVLSPFGFGTSLRRRVIHDVER